MCRPPALRNSIPARFWTSRPFLGKDTTRFRRKVESDFFVGDLFTVFFTVSTVNGCKIGQNREMSRKAHLPQVPFP